MNNFLLIIPSKPNIFIFISSMLKENFARKWTRIMFYAMPTSSEIKKPCVLIHFIIIMQHVPRLLLFFFCSFANSKYERRFKAAAVAAA